MNVIGIGKNEWAKGVPEDLVRACEKLNISYRLMDFSTLFQSQFSEITHLAPALFILKPHALEAYRLAQSQGVILLNPILSVEIADDKSKTYLALERANIPQVPTQLIDLDLEPMHNYFQSNPAACVFKMRHGGQGRWVRLVREESQLLGVYEEFIHEGIGPILAQPFIEEANGESIRVIVTGGEVVAASVRRATQDWRSNISLGGVQEKYVLTTCESDLAIAATKALGLGHAGVDLINMEDGIKVLEVNACPDFTSMRNISSVDIAEAVITATLKARNP
jgi:RimK family alpha-L-glutamate ligase